MINKFMHQLSANTWDVQWWTTMVSIAIINFLLMIFVFVKTFKWSKEKPELKKYFMFLRIFGTIFASVALYRSIFVSSYPNKLAWFDTILNSPFIIRSVAFFAELSFIGIITLILVKINKDFPLNMKNQKVEKYLALVPFFAFGCIFIANIFAFLGLITQYLTFFAIEETLWGIAFLLIMPVVLIRLKKIKGINDYHYSYKVFLIWMVAWCIGYSLFQWCFALPFMHWAEVSSDVGRVIPNGTIMESITNFTATRDFETWGGIGFFVWHSAYFSVCTWMVISFMLGPRKKAVE